jgi:hypothetical protein
MVPRRGFEPRTRGFSIRPYLNVFNAENWNLCQTGHSESIT